MAWLASLLAVACIGVGDGGHCLNPQPDLPCNHSMPSDDGPVAGSSSSAAGSAPIIALPGSGGSSLNVGTGGATASGAGAAPGDSGDAAAGDSSLIGAGGEAGSLADSAGAGVGAADGEVVR